MLITKLARRVKGTVRFQAEGGFTEQFLNNLARDGIHIWDIAYQNHATTANTAASDYRRIRGQAKKLGIRMKIVEKNGLPFVRWRYRKRIGLAAGVIIFFGILFAMGNFVWKIEVSGNEKIDSEVILDYLDQMGVRTGAFIPSLDTSEAETALKIKLDQLSWVALNLKGSVLRVRIKERTMPPVEIDSKDPCNVVAGQTGIIRYMEVYDGQPMAKVGDPVYEGQLIVSGVIESNNRTMLSHARAKVVAEVEETLEVSIPLERPVQTQTGESSTLTKIAAFGAEIPLGLQKEPEGDYILERRLGTPEVFGLRLPFEIVTETKKQVETHVETLTEEQAREEAMARLAAMEGEQLADSAAVRTGMRARTANGTFHLEATYKCRKDIAISKEILINN